MRQEERGFIRLNLVALRMMLVVIVGHDRRHRRRSSSHRSCSIPSASGRSLETLLRCLRWPILFGVALIVLAVIYRYGPSRTPARAGAGSAGGRPSATAIWTLGVHRVLDLRPELRQLQRDLRLARRSRHPADVVLVVGLHRPARGRAQSEMEHQTERDIDHRPGEAARPPRRLRRRPRRRGALITRAELALDQSARRHGPPSGSRPID